MSEKPELEVGEGASKAGANNPLGDDPSPFPEYVATGSTNGRWKLFSITGEEEHFATLRRSSPQSRRKHSSKSSKTHVICKPVESDDKDPQHSERITSVDLQMTDTQCWLASACADGIAMLWDVNARPDAPLLVFKQPEEKSYLMNSLRNVKFDRDLAYVITASSDGSARLWDTKSGKQRMTCPMEDDKGRFYGPTINCLDVRRTGTDANALMLATAGGDGIVYVWDLRKNHVPELRLEHNDGYSLARVHPHGQHQNRVEEVSPPEWRSVIGKGVTAVSFAEGRKFLTTGGADGSVKIWDLEANKPVGGAEVTQTLPSHNGSVLALAWDGDKIVSGSSDCSVRVSSSKTGQTLRTISSHSDWVNGVAYNNASGKLVTGSSDGTARLFHAPSGKEILEFEGHEAAVTSIAMAPHVRDPKGN